MSNAWKSGWRTTVIPRLTAKPVSAGRWVTLWERGHLLLDDTVIPKPFATAIERLAWVYSRQDRKPVYGLSLVLLVWTSGTVRLPLGMGFWHQGGASKSALALKLLSEARNHLCYRPESVLFDAWYLAKTFLRRIRDYGWYFIVCKNQLGFTGCQARSARAQLPPMACCAVAFCVRERQEQQPSIYKLKRRLSFKGRFYVLTALEPLKSVA